MLLRRWNCETHTYTPYEIADNKALNIKLYSEDMDEIVNCPHCLKEVKYGNTYTSLEFHNDLGLGFSVCEECYQKEWEERRKYESNR